MKTRLCHESDRVEYRQGAAKSKLALPQTGIGLRLSSDGLAGDTPVQPQRGFVVLKRRNPFDIDGWRESANPAQRLVKWEDDYVPNRRIASLHTGQSK